MFPPKSPVLLADMTSRVAAFHIVNNSVHNLAWFVGNHPLEIQHRISLQLKGSDLILFIHLNDNLVTLKTKWNDNMFQSFILHVLKQLENDDDHLNNHQIQLLQDEIDYLANELELLPSAGFQIPNSDDRFNPSNFDWTTQSLGLSRVFRQNVYSSTYEKLFFRSKFGESVNVGRYPFPAIQFPISSIIPAEAETKRCKALAYYRQPLASAPVVPSNINDLFFIKLLALSKAYNCNAHQEVLAYAADLLSNKIFLKNRCPVKCMFHVWGFVAMSLAKLQINSGIVDSCLFTMEESIDFESEKVDVMFYKQTAAMAMGRQQEEEVYFEQIINAVPVASHFYSQAFEIHLESTFTALEDVLLDSAIIDRVQSNNNRHLIGIKKQLLQKGLSTIGELKRRLHKLFASNRHIRHAKQFGHYFEIVNLYELAFDVSGDSHLKNKRGRFEAIAKKLDKSSHHFDYLLSWYSINTGYLVDDYQHNMKAIKACDELLSHSSCPLVWANKLFSHFIIQHILYPEGQEEIAAMSEACNIYTNYDHPRAAKLTFFNIAQHDSPFKPSLFPPSSSESPNPSSLNCNINWLLRTAHPDIKHCVRAGLDSISQNDN
jgi:hypothetical protein